MGYQFLDHMTDAYIEAHGSTMEEAFEFAAEAVVDTMISVKKPPHFEIYTKNN